MTKLSRKTFFRFAVELPEKGDTEGMQAILDRHPEHAEELLHGSRRGVDRGRYSAMAYATWLCGLPDYRAARRVVRWLLDQGLPDDVWVAVALDDPEAFRDHLERDPALVEARHPLWNTRIVEHVPPRYLEILAEFGADVSGIFMDLRRGRVDEVRRRVEDDPDLVGRERHEDGGSLLLHALIQGHDDLACFLIERGADVEAADRNGYRPLAMACAHACPRAARALVERGADPGHVHHGISMLRMAIAYEPPSAETVEMLLEAGLDPNSDRVDGGTLLDLCLEKGYDEIAERLRRRGGKRRCEL